MHVAVDRSRRERRSAGVDARRRALEIEVPRPSDAGDAAVDGDERVGVEHRTGEIAAQHQAYVLDDELRRRAAAFRFVMRHGHLPLEGVVVMRT